MSTTTVQKIIHNDLKLVPYKVQILPEQTDANKEERSEFCQTISEGTGNNPGDLGLILFNGEAAFSFEWACQQAKHEVLGISTVS